MVLEKAEMEEQTGGTKPIKRSDDEKRQKYGLDAARFSTGDLPIEKSDAPPDPEDEDSHISTTSEDSGSSGEETQLSGLAESLRILTDSLLTAEMEIFKTREAIRLEEEKRRLEVEAEMTQMLLQCQLQIASSLSARQGPNRKRKRLQEEDPSSSISLERNGALLLSLIQLNMITF